MTTEKKGWSLKNLFVEEVEVPETNSETQKVDTKPEVQSQPIVFSQPNVNIGTVSGVLDEKIYNGLHQSIEANDTKDISYIKFIKAKRALDSIPGMTDALKFNSVFATIQANTPNLTKDVLLSTADSSLQVLNNELKDFTNAVTAEREKKVNTKIQQINSKSELIAQKTAEIQKLQEEVIALQNDANQSATKIDVNEKNFNTTLEIVRNEINMDKTNITNFLK